MLQSLMKFCKVAFRTGPRNCSCKSTQGGSKLLPLPMQFMMYIDMAVFWADFLLDGACAYTYLSLRLYWVFGFQVAILLVSIFSETRLVKMQSEPDECDKWGVFFGAFTASIRRGFPTGTYLAIIMREKSVEAPLSLLLQLYASFWVPQSQDALIPVELAFLLSQASSTLSVYGVTKAAYIMYHLDMGRHLDALDEPPSKRKKVQCSSPSFKLCDHHVMFH